MKYRKKPVVIDAIQWNGKNHREMFDFLTNYELTNEFMSTSGENFYIDHDKIKGGLIIKTLEGEHLASIGDYIIKGVKGEFYPCKPDIFEQTYEERQGGAEGWLNINIKFSLMETYMPKIWILRLQQYL